jgi:predicted ATPase
MITRIEIDGFKTFDRFSIDLGPFCAIVGPNASGKSNLFDAIRLLSLLAKDDVRTAMTELRGEPEELFRKTTHGNARELRLAVEVLLPPAGVDQFGTEFQLKTQRLRYEIKLVIRRDERGKIAGIFVDDERCEKIKKSEDRAKFLRDLSGINYGGNMSPFLTTEERGPGRRSFRIRQDGPNKSGNPVHLPASEASRSALSTRNTAEFPHLYALKDFLSNPRFLEINPEAARRENDRFQTKELLPDASNLAAVIARIKDTTASDVQPEGALIDISSDLSKLIPSTRRVLSVTSSDEKEYSYAIEMAEGLTFSSRVISDGTLRLLALITVLNDPHRRGLLCFEEPENGIHEGRVKALVELMRNATNNPGEDYFQILTNTHSPAVMKVLKDDEIVLADIVSIIGPNTKERKTRMRRAPQPTADLIDPELTLTRFEIEKILQRAFDAA